MMQIDIWEIRYKCRSGDILVASVKNDFAAV